MQAILSKSLINTLKPGLKPYEVRDTRTPGLLLRVQPTGVMTYYLEIARGRRLKIGPVSVPIEDARIAATAHLGSVAKGKDPVQVQKQTKGLTFLAFIEQEFEPWAHVHLRTSAKLLQRLKSNCKRFHNKRLEHVSPQEFEKWRTERLKAGKKKRTVNRDLDDVRGVLSKALQWNFIESNPLAAVKKVKTDRMGSVRFLTSEEDTRLFEQLDAREVKIRQARDRANEWRKVRGYPLFPSLHNHEFADHLKPMVILSLNTGMRQGEVFDLEWRDVDLSAKRVTIRGEKAKSGQTRFIPLNATCAKALAAWRDQCPDDAELVFPGKDGQRFDTVKTAWKNVLKDAKVTKFRWHDMRHTFASRLVMKGVDLNTVRELMGHADYQMTLRYAHLAPEHKADAVARLIA
ncbi:MAG: site-specific integrase [Rhodospirillaceae bacterium]|nr:site-specific integrase [Rhodospirillaceae bacterium]